MALVLNLIMALLFCCINPIFQATIPKEDAIEVTGIFSSFHESFGRRRHLQEVSLHFKDRETLDIDGVCISDELRKELQKLEAGEKLSMLVHPDSDTILELRRGETILLHFEDAMEKLATETKTFFLLGLFYGGLSLYCLILLYRTGRGKQRKKQHHKERQR